MPCTLYIYRISDNSHTQISGNPNVSFENWDYSLYVREIIGECGDTVRHAVCLTDTFTILKHGRHDEQTRDQINIAHNLKKDFVQ